MGTFVNRDLKSLSMVFTEFVQIGGVVYVPSLKKACAITNVIDLNRLLVDDGNLNRYPGSVKKAFAAADIANKFAETDLAKGIARKNIRANLTDFDRFKLMRLKQARNRIVKAELGKLRRKK